MAEKPGRNSLEDGSLVTTYDDLGMVLFVPYFCRKGCNTGWSTKQARGAHERVHLLEKQGRKPGAPRKPEPELGTIRHYDWCRRNNLPTPQVDKEAWNKYMRDYYQAHPEKRP